MIVIKLWGFRSGSRFGGFEIWLCGLLEVVVAVEDVVVAVIYHARYEILR